MTGIADRIGDGQADAYRRSVGEVVAALHTDPRRGLSEDEARSRLEQVGPNELAAEKPVPAWRKLLAQFQDVLVILLLIATVISAGLWAYERNAALQALRDRRARTRRSRSWPSCCSTRPWGTCRSRAPRRRSTPSGRCRRTRPPSSAGGAAPTAG